MSALERTQTRWCTWFLPAGNEEEAAGRFRESSVQTGLMLKEKEVFALGLKRRTNPVFSEELYKSLCAVQDHVTSILRKLGLKSRREILRDL